MEYGGEIDYAALDYVAGGQDLESIFIASVAIAGLGAVMDVAVSIAAALNELILKDPGISVKSLARSGREIGHDIMGTMINVLLFTYICGLIPLMIMKMKNEVSLLTIVRLQIPFGNQQISDRRHRNRAGNPSQHRIVLHNTEDREEKDMIYILAAVFFLLLLIVGGDRGAYL